MQGAVDVEADQLSLPLPPDLNDGRNEGALRVAHRSARVRIPFELAMRDRALAICLRCLSEAKQKQKPSAQGSLLPA